MNQKSFHAKPQDTQRGWQLVDLKDQVLGRAASRIASILRGKTKPTYTRSTDVGDFVVAINAHQIKLTGRKWDQKMYYRHTGYMGGLKETSAKHLKEKKPEEILYFAVKGMIPKTPLGRKQLKKLKIYAGSEHPHVAQKPQTA